MLRATPVMPSKVANSMGCAGMEERAKISEPVTACISVVMKTSERWACSGRMRPSVDALELGVGVGGSVMRVVEMVWPAAGMPGDSAAA